MTTHRSFMVVFASIYLKFRNKGEYNTVESAQKHMKARSLVEDEPFIFNLKKFRK